MTFEFSAGGVVYKVDPSASSGFLILVSQHSQHKGWVFPKGLIGDRDQIKGEKKEDTAIREVKEETGADGEIVKELTPISYWYVWEGDKRKKTVYYFIMKYVGGDITEHDHEMQAVEWLPADKVLEKLTYKSDKDVYKEALPIIKTLANS
ncbi:MAG TPA: NUDIX domain-containing protein [Patescibacteria group bacterium]|nr:NUDIX domain-containing protein [Patescibacteria group bacterium]